MEGKYEKNRKLIPGAKNQHYQKKNLLIIRYNPTGIKDNKKQYLVHLASPVPVSFVVRPTCLYGEGITIQVSRKVKITSNFSVGESLDYHPSETFA